MGPVLQLTETPKEQTLEQILMGVSIFEYSYGSNGTVD